MTPLRVVVDLKLPPDVMDLMRSSAPNCDWNFVDPAGSSLASAENPLSTADVAFGQPDPGAIATAQRLKWIHVSSSGITKYDSPEFRALVTERRIQVTNSAGVYSEPCAVHALSFILAQARRLPAAIGSRVAGGTETWQALRNSSSILRGETIVIVGFGAIGRRLAELLKGLGMRIVACRRRSTGDEGLPTVPFERWDVALREAEHVMNILPDAPGTRHYFNRSRLFAMKPGAIFYNIGRGTTVDQDALFDALQQGHLGAAWLDVTEPEPLPDGHILWTAPNCYITPHTAGGHPNELRQLTQYFLENLNRFLEGRPLLDRVM
ncbi:MAG TPA: D-2-hydroxyacid dehydrogenase [Verrucomicrobia bacterium]|nr:D-2-hydroxyacid dehydrogenase [Verrucomicrobiota bacterium]HOP95861.1 D-2-hydroxyacid dehydrogenase [Verrucomicrobiota bacterium]